MMQPTLFKADTKEQTIYELVEELCLLEDKIIGLYAPIGDLISNKNKPKLDIPIGDSNGIKYKNIEQAIIGHKPKKEEFEDFHAEMITFYKKKFEKDYKKTCETYAEQFNTKRKEILSNIETQINNFLNEYNICDKLKIESRDITYSIKDLNIKKSFDEDKISCILNDYLESKRTDKHFVETMQNIYNDVNQQSNTIEPDEKVLKKQDELYRIIKVLNDPDF